MVRRHGESSRTGPLGFSALARGKTNVSDVPEVTPVTIVCIGEALSSQVDLEQVRGTLMPIATPSPLRAASTWWRVALALFAASMLVVVRADAREIALQGAWRPAHAHEQPATLSDPGLQRFDPARPRVFAPGEAGSWILLWPGTQWPAAPFVVEVGAPGMQTAHFFPPDSTGVQSARLMSTKNALAGTDRLAFRVAQAPATGQPLRLLLEARDVTPVSVTFTVRSMADYVRADTRWVAFASACLAVMLTVLLIAIFFCIWLRDPTFAWYAVFNLGYATIFAIQSGYVIEPLGWSFVAAAPKVWGRIATALAVTGAMLFVSRFADLRRHAPRWRLFLLGHAGVVVALTAYSLLPVPGAQAFVRSLINPLLALGMLSALAAGVIAAIRGSRYALLLLAGWAPLLLINALGSAQLPEWTPDWVFGDATAMGAGAFEALVLAFGLVRRSAVMRREHTQARRLADIDPLTGVFNRRAWARRLAELQERTRLRGESLSLLFLDLDRFKDINDRFGHDAGDHALQTVAAVMREELRDVDEIGRYGGEEFVVALPGVDARRAVHIAERIRGRLQQLAAATAGGRLPTVSIGVASTHDEHDIDALIKRADRAMYAAKKNGRNRTVLEPGDGSGPRDDGPPGEFEADSI
jgi:diguanylate cyclase (GGDEF)-like protein